MKRCYRRLLIVLIVISVCTISTLRYCHQLEEERAEKAYQKLWFNHLKYEEINSNHNPYRVTDYVYQYGIREKILDQFDQPPSHYCRFEVFTIDPLGLPEDKLKSYLDEHMYSYNAYRKEFAKYQNSPVVIIDEYDFFFLKWMYTDQVTDKYFKEMAKITKKDYPNAKSLYQRYHDCISLLTDSQPFLTENTDSRIYEYDKYGGFDRQAIAKVVTNPKTLVQINLYPANIGRMYFYDANEKYFIILSFKAPKGGAVMPSTIPTNKE